MTHYEKVAQAIDELRFDYFADHKDMVAEIAKILEREFPDKPALKLDCETVPPSPSQVVYHAKTIGLTENDALCFIAFYDSKGWMVGKNKMKSWKGALAGWKLRREGEPVKNVNGNGHPTDAQMIAMTKERERIAERLKWLKGQASHDAWGPMYNSTQTKEIKRLKTRDSELKQLLHITI